VPPILKLCKAGTDDAAFGYKSLNPKYFVNWSIKPIPKMKPKVLVRHYIGHKNSFVKIGLHGCQKIPCHM
jgi:hypothetical protein